MTADHVAAENFGRANFSGESIAPAPPKFEDLKRLPALVAKAKKRRKKKNQLARWLVKDAKAAGCPAFKGGGRVRRDELLAWEKEINGISDVISLDSSVAHGASESGLSDRQRPGDLAGRQ